MRCDYCRKDLLPEDEIRVTRRAVVRRDTDMSIHAVEMEGTEVVVHKVCMGRAALDLHPDVAEQLYEEVMDRIRDEGQCPMCSPFLPS